jgi:hypothetical protein
VSLHHTRKRITNTPDGMSSTTEAVALGLQRLEEAKKPFLAGEANSTEAVLDAARAILLAGGREQDRALASSSSKKEKASDFMQRVMWAEVSMLITGSLITC